MDYTIREMQPDEARQVQWLGTKVFARALEGFAIPRPKIALVAEKDGKIAGGVVYSGGGEGAKKWGSIDYLIVDKAYAGQGIGSALCREAVTRLWDDGCEFLATTVRDDNVGSWACFEKLGFVRADVPAAAKTLGFAEFIKLLFGKLHAINVDCDFYFAARPENPPPPAKKTGAPQMVLHVFVNAAIFFAAAMFGGGAALEYAPELLLSAAVILSGIILIGFAGTSHKREWHYRTVSGGVPLSAVFTLLGIFLPVFGGWYPNRYENTPEFRRDMGISALLPWLFVMAAFAAARFANIQLAGFASLAGTLLIFRCIPMPHVNFGMSRVFRWNKIVCAVMIAASLALFFIP